MSDVNTSEDLKQDSAPQPSWLDQALIQQALHNGGEGNCQVTAISVKYAVAAGDNYISTVYRVKATLSDGTERSFFVKGPALGGMSEMAKDCGIFERESAMLSDYIPKMQALLEEAAPGRFPPFAPRCYLHGSSPVDFIIMEDVAAPGFKMADRKRGLDLKHCLVAVRYLARFHAASHVLLQRQPEVAKLRQPWKWEDLRDYVHGELQATVIACRSWPGYEKYAEHLEKFKLISGPMFEKVNEPKPGAFNVLTHGDFWVNNIMYRYEDGYPEEIRAVDLQLSQANSPAIDLLHFFASSPDDDVDLHHKDLLLREYHVELKHTLQLLGQQVPTLESLLSAMDDHGPYALYIALETPIVKADHSVNIDAITSGDYSGLLRLLEFPDIKRRMQHILKEYTQKGWLPS